MEKLSFELKNCYGINYLKDNLDFSRKNIFSIYAPNGSMKTSFSKTFLMLSQGEEPKDDLYQIPSEYTITTDNNETQSITSEEIFVIKPYDAYTANESISTLLVDEARKTEYDTLIASILTKKKSLITNLNKYSGIKKDSLENVLLKDVGETNLIEFLDNLNINELSDTYKDIKYSLIFNADVLSFLRTPDVIDNINNYITEYNRLLEESSYYMQGVFNPSKADTITKTLTKENFFRAGHAVKLNGKDEILTEEEFNAELDAAKLAITGNANLKKIETLLTKKATVKDFQDLISEKPSLLVELALNNLANFKKVLWYAYIKSEETAISILVNDYNEAKGRLEEIEAEASNQVTKWKKVVEKFKERFSVPFDISIANKTSAILGKEAPNLIFNFDDNNGNTSNLERERLNTLDILSQGEKRALYLLNIIFEVQAKKLSNQITLFIIDDIADSFDYKNKYAIIEYLKEISEYEHFYQIILTHNFDFFRTINSRLNMDRSNKLQVIKTDTEIKLIPELYQKKHPFQVWKDKLSSDVKYILVLVPFVRNLIEYGKNIETDFLFLTNLLHQKADTRTIKFSDLKTIYSEYLDKDNFGTVADDDFVYESIMHYADNINPQEHNLENKIILAMAIRLKAEEVMKESISNKADFTFSWSKKVGGIPTEFTGNNTDFLVYVNEASNQTRTLYDGYKQFETDENKETIESVLLMTPENIHLNSFMYEPIMDMSIDNLTTLYTKLGEI